MLLIAGKVWLAAGFNVARLGIISYGSISVVSAIEVGEKVYDTPNHTTQNVSVNYKFISQLC